MEKVIFAVFLAIAAWQDLRRQAVDVWIYLLFGGLAIAAGVYRILILEETYAIAEHGAGIAMGLMLLALCRISGGGIGMGDGCFFLVTGILLGFWENVALLCYGTLLSGVFCLCWFVGGSMLGQENIRKKTFPFLPFLTLPGIWLIWFR